MKVAKALTKFIGGDRSRVYIATQLIVVLDLEILEE